MIQKIDTQCENTKSRKTAKVNQIYWYFVQDYKQKWIYAKTDKKDKKRNPKHEDITN